MLCIVALALLAVFSCGETAVAPVEISSSMLRQTLPDCPGSCCKKYCIAGAAKECTAGATASAFTCATSKANAKGCFNKFGTGCGATVCKPRTSCATSCGTVIEIADIVTCN